MDTTLDHGHASGVVSGSRRRSVRLRAPDHLRGAMDRGGAALNILDISEGGLAALIDSPSALDSIHTLALTLGSVGPVVVRAQVASCLLIEPRPGSGLVYRTGFRFLGRAKPGTGTIEDLIDRLLTSSIRLC